MRIPPTGQASKFKQAIGRRLPKRRDDSGLTTLEWLLIVAAVAGLAALAVVLVTRVVSDTSEDIAGQSARKTAATLAAQALTDEARAIETDGATTALKDADAARLNTEYKRKCLRFDITYGDVEDLDVAWGHHDGTSFNATTEPNTAARWDLTVGGPTCQIT